MFVPVTTAPLTYMYIRSRRRNDPGGDADYTIYTTRGNILRWLFVIQLSTLTLTIITLSVAMAIEVLNSGHLVPFGLLIAVIIFGLGAVIGLLTFALATVPRAPFSAGPDTIRRRRSNVLRWVTVPLLVYGIYILGGWAINLVQMCLWPRSSFEHEVTNRILHFGVAEALALAMLFLISIILHLVIGMRFSRKS